MTSFLLKLGPALEVLTEMALDANPSHRRDSAWTAMLLSRLTGPRGFVRLILFSIDADFAVVTHKLIRLQDCESPDVALSAMEVLTCLETCQALFDEGRIFDKEPNDTYTNSLLQGLEQLERTIFRDGTSGKIGWPDAADSQLMGKVVKHARKLYSMAKGFFPLNFPDHDWRTRFSAFACGKDQLPRHLRFQHVEELAKKEGLNPAETRQQFACALPHMARLHAQTGENRAAWAAYLDSMCRAPGRPKFRRDAHSLVQLTLTYLGVMDGTSDCERMFSRLELAEAKRSVRHHNPETLMDILKVALDGPADLDSLVTVAPKPVLKTDACTQESRLVKCMWHPKQFITDCQRQYAEFYGTRRLATRKVEPVSIPERASQLAAVRKRMSFLPRNPLTTGADGKQPLSHRRKLWEEAAEKLRAQMNASHDAEIAEERRTFFDVSPSERQPEVKKVVAALQRRLDADRVLHKRTENSAVPLALPARPVRVAPLLKLQGPMPQKRQRPADSLRSRPKKGRKVIA